MPLWPPAAVLAPVPAPAPPGAPAVEALPVGAPVAGAPPVEPVDADPLALVDPFAADAPPLELVAKAKAGVA